MDIGLCREVRIEILICVRVIHNFIRPIHRLCWVKVVSSLYWYVMYHLYTHIYWRPGACRVEDGLLSSSIVSLLSSLIAEQVCWRKVPKDFSSHSTRSWFYVIWMSRLRCGAGNIIFLSTGCYVLFSTLGVPTTAPFPRRTTYTAHCRKHPSSHCVT